MKTFGRVLLAAVVLVFGCPNDRTSSVTNPRARHDASNAAPPATDAAAPESSDPPVEALLDLAHPDTPLAGAEFDRLFATLLGARDPKIRAAALLAATRRAPRAALARVAAAVAPAAAESFARALAGRSRSLAPQSLPAVLLALASPPARDVGVATVVTRFRLDIPELPPATAIDALRSPIVNDQVFGARTLAARSQALPETPLLDALGPAAIQALIRPLSTRDDVPGTLWAELLRMTALRARQAPRVWGNAWRLARNMAPQARPEVRTQLVSLFSEWSVPTGLASTVLARWRCEDASALDRVQAQVAATLTCADGALAPIALAAQADVIARIAIEPTRAAAMLTSIARGAHGDARVLIAVAGAAGTLTPASGIRVLRGLLAERDPGVMAAVLEALAEHPPLLAGLPTRERDALVHAPFALPEGPSLEARIHAIRVARIVGLADVVAQARTSSARAIRSTAEPDASLVETATPPPASLPPTRIRFELEFGSFVVEVATRRTPRAAAVLVDAARGHRYDGLTFHRVEPDFVVQGGDPRGDGTGGTDVPLHTELSLAPFRRGTVGIPLAGLDTGGMQIFVVTSDAPHLDARYPAAGDVVQGMDSIDAILPGDRIVRAVIVESSEPRR